MTDKDGRWCDRCGCRLTEKNNKCGFEICDKCNDWLEKYLVNNSQGLVKGLSNDNQL